MALNYAEKWQPQLLEIMLQDTLTSPFITTNVNWLNAKTFHFTQMSTSGYKNHSRSGGWNAGTYTQTDVPYTVAHDRDVEFLVDKADVDETNATASIQNITTVFQKTHANPEIDAYFFSKVATTAAGLTGYHTSTAEASYTVDNVYEKLKGFIAAGKLKRYKAQGALIMYVRSFVMDLLERSSDFTRKIEMTQVAPGGMGLETRITSIDGVAIIEVIDDERFYSAFNFTTGFVPATGAYKINALVCSPLTVKTVPKIASIYSFAPGVHTKGDGWLYQNRSFWDTFIFPNGLDGEIDSVYVDLDTTAVS
jgi:hypothetical protein